MKKLVAEPLISVGAIKFGMKRESIRNLLGNYSEFRKSQYSKNTTDSFSFCHVYYDEDDCCEAIEIFDAEVSIKNQVVFPCKADMVMKLFPNAVEEYGNYLDKEQSIGIYAPDDVAESVLFGRKGYYL